MISNEKLDEFLSFEKTSEESLRINEILKTTSVFRNLDPDSLTRIVDAFREKVSERDPRIIPVISEHLVIIFSEVF